MNQPDNNTTTNMNQPDNNTTTEDPSIAWWNSRTYEEKVDHLDMLGVLLVRNDMGMLVDMIGEEREAKIVELGVIRERHEENAT